MTSTGEQAAAHCWKVIGDLNVGLTNNTNLHILLQELQIVRPQDFEMQQQLDAQDALIWLLHCIQLGTTSAAVGNFGVEP